MSTMPENEPSVTASKFVASLVKSLQLICNGDVNFSECVELVGYINVRVDNKLKFDYVVDEQVCKDRNDSSTKFLSNSYHSSPRCFPSAKDAPNEAEKDISTGDIIDFTLQETIGQASSRDQSLENLYSVKVQSPRSQANHMVVKLEGGDDSNDCMVLPTTDGSFEKLDESGGVEAVSASSSRPAEDSGDKMCTRKKQKEKDAEVSSKNKNKTQVVPRRVMPKRNKSKINISSASKVVHTKPRVFMPTEELRTIDTFWKKKDKTYYCNICPYNTSFRNRMRGHCRSVHMGIPRKYKGNEKGFFVCDKCGKEFTSKRGFRMHTLTKHLNKFTYDCQECNRGFMSVVAYRDHMNMHAGIALQCMGCQLLFYTEHGLKRHLIRKHPDMIH